MLKKIYHISAEDGAATEMYEIDAREAVAKFPKEWSDTPWPKSKDADKQKDAVPAAVEPKAPFEAKSKGSGWWAIFDADGVQVGKNMREPDAVTFNAMSDDDKLEYVKAEVAES
ncbi:hypothetical protein [Rhizobium leguminosarum]|uniref:hypothetical protein n=1 Tax=Rhizobium leguminosarum TaxID=384 RepID=UPI0016208FF9|nr:hypothetical protein [Rhizobium leguminosarum]MBB4342148.1 hypothetical protein [Rhizobium leguminosarum]MBB6294772.1 hypothetical protein [Rhizobium leguminosarum]